MRSGSTRERSEGDGWGLVCLAVVILVIGGLLLYKKEGGKLFGPGGIVAPPRVSGFLSRWDKGVFTYYLVLKNGSSADLTDVDVTITLFEEDGMEWKIKRIWAEWRRGEAKRIHVMARRYAKHTIQGTARRDGQLVSIDSSWTTTWK